VNPNILIVVFIQCVGQRDDTEKTNKQSTINQNEQTGDDDDNPSHLNLDRFSNERYELDHLMRPVRRIRTVFKIITVSFSVSILLIIDSKVS